MYITRLPIVSLCLQYRLLYHWNAPQYTASYSWWFHSKANETDSAMDVTYIANTKQCNWWICCGIIKTFSKAKIWFAAILRIHQSWHRKETQAVVDRLLDSLFIMDLDMCQLGKERLQTSLKISPFISLLPKPEKQDCSEQVEWLSCYGLRGKRPEFRAAWRRNTTTLLIHLFGNGLYSVQVTVNMTDLS